MKNKFVKLTKNPLTWIAFILVCVFGVVVWFFKSGKDD